MKKLSEIEQEKQKSFYFTTLNSFSNAQDSIDFLTKYSLNEEVVAVVDGKNSVYYTEINMFDWLSWLDERKFLEILSSDKEDIILKSYDSEGLLDRLIFENKLSSACALIDKCIDHLQDFKNIKSTTEDFECYQYSFLSHACRLFIKQLSHHKKPHYQSDCAIDVAIYLFDKLQCLDLKKINNIIQGHSSDLAQLKINAMSTIVDKNTEVLQLNNIYHEVYKKYDLETSFSDHLNIDKYQVFGIIKLISQSQQNPPFSAGAMKKLLAKIDIDFQIIKQHIKTHRLLVNRADTLIDEKLPQEVSSISKMLLGAVMSGAAFGAGSLPQSFVTLLQTQRQDVLEYIKTKLSLGDLEKSDILHHVNKNIYTSEVNCDFLYSLMSYFLIKSDAIDVLRLSAQSMVEKNNPTIHTVQETIKNFKYILQKYECDFEDIKIEFENQKVTMPVALFLQLLDLQGKLLEQNIDALTYLAKEKGFSNVLVLKKIAQRGFPDSISTKLEKIVLLNNVNLSTDKKSPGAFKL